jgi:hypothetical protein
MKKRFMKMPCEARGVMLGDEEAEAGCASARHLGGDNGHSEDEAGLS